MTVKIGKIFRGGGRTCREWIKRVLTVISPKLETAINYRYTCGEWLDWKHPQDINAKINWLKCNTYYNNPEVTMCIDKYRVREWMKAQGEEALCPKLYGAYDAPEEIDWDALPQQFVVKCNHGCGMNLIVKDKSKLDIPEAVEKLRGWMKTDYWRTGEVQYRFIRKKIFAEEYLGDGEDLKTVKFFCFNGVPKILYLSMEEDLYIDYYNMNFERLPYSLAGHLHSPNAVEQLANFERMVAIAKKLSAHFPFVRVDLYDSFGKIYLSELTFVPTGGYMKIEPKEVLKEWGEWLALPTNAK